MPFNFLARGASYSKVWGLLIVLAVLYGYLVFFGPVMDASGTKHGLLPVIFIVTLIGLQTVVWMLAARGALAIRQYANSIKGSPDAKGINDVALALGWLVVYMVTLSLTGALATFYSSGSHAEWFIALRNHGPLLIMMISAFYLFRGASKLSLLANAGFISRRQAAIVSLIFILGSTWFVVHFFASVSESIDGNMPRFVVPAKALLFTYVIPHLLVWAAVIVSIINIARYSLYVDGAIYRRLFKNLYRGTSAVFICIFLAQIIMASSVDVSKLSWLIVVIYGVIMIATYGFMLIYRGVRDLTQIDAT